MPRTGLPLDAAAGDSANRSGAAPAPTGTAATVTVRFLCRSTRTARVSPTRLRQNESRIDHIASATRSSSGVVGGGTLMLLLVG